MRPVAVRVRGDRRTARVAAHKATLALVSVLAVTAALVACSGAVEAPGGSADASADGPESATGAAGDGSSPDATEPDAGDSGGPGKDGGAMDSPADVQARDGSQDARDGVADAAPLEAGLDASTVDASAGEAADGAIEEDGAPDAAQGDATVDAGPTLQDLLALCEGGGDVFYIDAVGPTNGDPVAGVQVFNDTNAQWTASTAALSVSVRAGAPGVGAALSVTTTAGIPLAPGTYAEPINHSNPRPYLDISLGDVDLTADGATSGSFLVHDIDGVAVGGRSTAFLAVSFDIAVPGANELRGCVRYGVTTVPDAADVGVDVDATLGSADASSPGGDAASCGDTNSDSQNCGTCGHDCLGGLCSAGVCMPVTIFAEDDGSPQGIAVDTTNVYWVETEGPVRMMPKGGGTATLLATEPRGPTGLVLDSGVLYWVSQAGNLRSLTLGSAAPPTTLATFASSSFGVAVDATYVYWTMIGENPVDFSPAGTVTAIPRTGGALVPVAGGQNVPDGIAVGGGNAYWIDLDTQLPQSAPSAMQAPLDGGSPAPLFVPPAGPSQSLDAIASDATYVYFTSGGNLYRAPLAGGAPMLLASGLDATALAVDDSGIYALVGSAVLRAPLGGGVATTMIQGLFSPRGLALDAQAVYFTDFDVVMRIAK